MSTNNGMFPVRGYGVASGKFPNMKTLAERVQSRIDALGLKPAKIATEQGWKPDYIRDILRGKKDNISGEKAAVLARVLQCDLTWLSTGRESDLSSEDVAYSLTPEGKRENNGHSTLEKYKPEVPGAVPEVDARAGAGKGNVGDQEVVTLRRGDSYIGHKVTAEWVFPQAFLRHELRSQPGGIMVIEVIGDSMYPTLESGDRVIIDTSYNTPTPDGIYVIDEGDGPMVKRLQLIRRSDPPEIRILSDNKNHEAYTLRLSDIRVIGRVSGRVTKM